MLEQLSQIAGALKTIPLYILAIITAVVAIDGMIFLFFPEIAAKFKISELPSNWSSPSAVGLITLSAVIASFIILAIVLFKAIRRYCQRRKEQAIILNRLSTLTIEESEVLYLFYHHNQQELPFSDNWPRIHGTEILALINRGLLESRNDPDSWSSIRLYAIPDFVWKSGQLRSLYRHIQMNRT